MMYPLVRELAGDGIPVTVTCRVLKIARQPYYCWLAQPVTDAELVEAYRANVLFDAHQDDPEFGYRFLVDEAREAGEPMAERTAWRICSQLGWWSAFGKPKCGKAKKAGPPVHDDLCAIVDDKDRVRHEFNADAPNGLWLTDITEHRSGEQQFRSRKFVHALNRHGMVGSMGRVGAAGDNAAMESFFSLLLRTSWTAARGPTREELRIAIVKWIERTYHRRRRQVALGRLTPIEFETIMTPPATQAA